MRHGPLRKTSLALVAGCVAALVANVTPAAAPSVSAPPPGPPLVGFSFSPFSVPRLLNETPTAALRTLVETLQPDLVRLPIYWSQAQPWPDAFDYSSTEALIAVIRQHNRHARQPTRIVFSIGARNLGYPEIYLPGWLPNAQGSNLRQIVASPAYATYLRTTVERYADSREIAEWPVKPTTDAGAKTRDSPGRNTDLRLNTRIRDGSPTSQCFAPALARSSLLENPTLAQLEWRRLGLLLDKGHGSNLHHSA